MDTVLITGATGFVGSHVAAAFAAAGFSVRCAVRPTSDLRWLRSLAVETVTARLEDVRGVAAAVAGTRIVVHVAGITRAPRTDAYHRVNVEGTERVAAAASAAGCERFVFISSLAARGPDGSAGPTSDYGRSKQEAERRLRAMGLPGTVVLRPGGVYGPRDRDMVPLFRLAARGWLVAPAGARVLQPIFVTDVAGAVLAAATRSPAPGFGPFPLLDPSRYSWEEVRGALERSLGRGVRLVRLPSVAYELAGRLGQLTGQLSGRPPPFDLRRARDLARHTWTEDVAETERRLGWRARVALPEGIDRTLRWYREAGWLRG